MKTSLIFGLLCVGVSGLGLLSSAFRQVAPAQSHSKPALKKTKVPAFKPLVKNIPSDVVLKKFKLPKGKYSTQIRFGSAWCDYAYTVDELIGSRDALLIGRPVQSFQNRDHYYTLQFDGAPDLGFTEGDFLVETVLTQIPSLHIASGQTIRLSEQVALFPPTGNIVSQTIMDDCYPLQGSSRYLIAVNPSSPSGYFQSNLNLGRFNIDGTDPFDDVAAVNFTGGITDKRQLRDALVARFNVTGVVEPLPTPRCSTSFPPSANPATSRYIAYSCDRVTSPVGELVLERQINDGAWTEVNRRSADGPCTVIPPPRPGGGVPLPVNYGYTDTTPLASGTVCLYRLRQVSGTRTSYYSAEASVTVP